MPDKKKIFPKTLTFPANLLQSILMSVRTKCPGKKKKKEASEMRALGRHILAEFHGCPPEFLNDMQRIERTMVDAALEAGAEIREVAFHKFSPQGVSGVVVISESHLAIHTWPELGYAAVDVFTCGETVDPWVCCNYLRQHLLAKDTSSQEILRGNINSEASRKVSNF
jgi:S-adenosylmethionine decarboxylase